MKKVLSKLRRCAEDYAMIDNGDVIAVGISGGKDSLVTLAALHRLSMFLPNKFTVKAITVGIDPDPEPYAGVKNYCDSIGVEYIFIPSDIKQVVFDIRKEPNPCSLCANMRRGALNKAAAEHGCGKVALGHHMDDAVETFMMSLFYEGRISCFSPVTRLSRSGVTVIRPMLYVSESDIRRAIKHLPVSVVRSSCPANGITKRQDTKELIVSLGHTYGGFKKKIFGAMQRLPLDGWGPGGEPSDRVFED